MTQQPGSAPLNEDEPLSLDFDDAAAAGQTSQNIKAFGAAAMAGRTEQKLARAMLLPAPAPPAAACSTPRSPSPPWST